MHIIYKYQLENNSGSQIIELPKGAKMLKLDQISNVIYFWVVFDELNIDTLVENEFVLIETGAKFDLHNLQKIGTVILFEGSLVYHVFFKRK